MSSMYNLSYFVQLLPVDFDNWTAVDREAHFTDHLKGFAQLDPESKKEIATNLSAGDILDQLGTWYSPTTEAPPANIEEFFEKLFAVFLSQLQGTGEKDYCEESVAQASARADLIRLIGPAILLTILLMLLKPRKALWLDCFWGRPFAAYPVNFVDEMGRRWAFVASFAITTDAILDLFGGGLIISAPHMEEEYWKLRFTWVKTLIMMLNVFIVGLVYYPIFGAISNRRHIAANIIGFIYVIPVAVLDSRRLAMCPAHGSSDQKVEFISRMIVGVPIFIGYVTLIVSYILDFIINIRRMYREHRAEDKVLLPAKTRLQDSLPLTYINELMNRKVHEEPKTLVGKLKHALTYNRMKGFQYSPRVICTMAVAAVFLYAFAVRMAIKLNTFLENFEVMFSNELFEMILGNNTQKIDQITKTVSGIRWAIFTSNMAALILHFVFMIDMIRKYKKDIRRYLRGDHSWHFQLNTTPARATVSGMRYSGYQIGYILSGYLITFGLFSIFTLIVVIFFIIPIMYGKRSWLINKIIMYLPSIALAFIIYYAQVILTKFCFLHERGKYMGLNNRRLYHVTTYFLFFFNIVLGIVSVLKRTIVSFVLGCVLICRIDRCLMMPGFENLDQGFKAYLGMLSVDIYHSHPIIKGFILILKEEVEDTRRRHATDAANAPLSHRFDKRIRNKWWKLITLINNPRLLLSRLHERLGENKAKGHPLRDGGMDAVAGTCILVLGAGLAESDIISTPL